MVGSLQHVSSLIHPFGRTCNVLAHPISPTLGAVCLCAEHAHQIDKSRSLLIRLVRACTCSLPYRWLNQITPLHPSGGCDRDEESAQSHCAPVAL